MDPLLVILEHFVKAGNEFVSGSVLSESLGVSRVSIKYNIDRLREEGFVFEASTNRGYRLDREPDSLHDTLIRAYLKHAGVSQPFFFFPEIDSTNSEAERLLASGHACPFAVLARKQIAGRGRYGRYWVSENHGGNIYLSMAFKPDMSLERMQRFTLWMGLRVCDYFNRMKVPVKMKWPNDIVSDWKKVAGILTEARVEADCLHHVVFGIGVNMNENPADISSELASKATSVSAITNRKMSSNLFSAGLIKSLYAAYGAFVDGSYGLLLPSLWDKHDFLKGKTVTAERGKTLISGVVSGVDDNGNLLLVCADGSMEKINSGEVSLSKNYQP